MAQIPEVSDALDTLVEENDLFLLPKSCSMQSRLLGKKLRCPRSTSDLERNVKRVRQEQYVMGLSSKIDSLSMDKSNLEASSSSRAWIFKQLGGFSSPSSTPDVISTIDYDENNQLIATGGLARKVRICSYRALVTPELVLRLFTTICMPAKLSSLKWRPGSSDIIGCGDYDGSVTEWDVEHGISVSERYEHSGGTVWSIDYSKSTQGLMASASSDSTVRFWSKNVEDSVGLIKSPKGNSMCSIEFNPWNAHHIAAGCADARVYVYDLRNLSAPLLDLRGHERSVGYVRWIGERRLVTSSPDGSIRLWDWKSESAASCSRTFRHHANSRNFVGLSVTEQGLIASGSETNEVFVYSTSRDIPIYQREFSNVASAIDDKPFVASVCWTRQEGHLSLISANSEGSLQVVKAASE